MSGDVSSPCDADGRWQLPMLAEIYNLAMLAAGDVWPTSGMALGRLFERGAVFLDSGSELPRIVGSADPDLLESLNISREELFLIEALYLTTRHATFVATEAGAALEAAWVELADRHLAIRSEIVDRRRDEERLKRELRALGGEAVLLPEHDDVPMSTGNRPRKSRGMFATLFDGATIVDTAPDVAPPILEIADRAIEAGGLGKEWGEHARLLVLTYGISLALREGEADQIDANDDASVKAAQAAVRERMMGLDGRYATLRRRLFELRHNNRILQWRITALEVEAQGMRSRLDQFLVDRDRLEAAIAKRRADGAVQRAEGASNGRTDWRRRLGRLLGRRD